jgi:hypothetical protein
MTTLAWGAAVAAGATTAAGAAEFAFGGVAPVAVGVVGVDAFVATVLFAGGPTSGLIPETWGAFLCSPKCHIAQAAITAAKNTIAAGIKRLRLIKRF